MTVWRAGVLNCETRHISPACALGGRGGAAGCRGAWRTAAQRLLVPFSPGQSAHLLTMKMRQSYRKRACLLFLKENYGILWRRKFMLQCRVGT